MNDKELESALSEFEKFDVVDEVVVGDLSQLKEERNLIPPTRAAKLRIKKASINDKNKDYRSLNLSMSLEDGVLVGSEIKYKGMIVWGRVTYYANLEKYTKDYFKKRQHLNDLKKLVAATGGNLADIKINDEFIQSLEGKLILADIKQKQNNFTAKDGTEVKEIRNEVANYKALPTNMII